tara:strand:+ start:2671 stop:2901 length:231 start_codon:yes stop_codon:yes gene_type:complete
MQELKSIGIGSWITIVLVLGNIMFVAGVTSKDVSNAQKTASKALEKAIGNEKDIAVIENSIDKGFEAIEKLIKHGN